MRLVIGPNVIDLDPLDSVLDQAIADVFRSYLGGVPMIYSHFESAALNYFSQPTVDWDGYLRNFTRLWNMFFPAGHLREAESVWNLALKPVSKWESQNPGRTLHKGTPYYFWAMTAFEAGKLDYGFALMHQAYEEDKRASGQPFPQQPAFFFVSLDFQQVNQAYRPRVQTMANYVEARLTDFNSRNGKAFSLDDFAGRFLKTPPDAETTFLFTHVVARLLEFEKIPRHAVRSVFAGQLEVNILFDLALVIDSAIHGKNPGDSKFIDHASFLAAQAGVPLSKSDLRTINGSFQADFDNALQQLLSLTYGLPSGTVRQLAAAIAVTYGIRNRGAHNVAASPAFYQSFPKVRDWMFDCLLLAVDSLY